MDFLGPINMMGGGPVPEIEFVASAVTSAATITIPGTAAAGDLALLFTFTAAWHTISPPSGWSAVGTVLSSGNNMHGVARKVLSVGDAGSTVNPLAGGSSFPENIMLVFRPPDGFSWGTPASANQQASTSGVSNQTITAGATPYIAVAAYRSNTHSAAGFSPSYDGQVSQGFTHYVRYKIFNAGAAAVTVSYGAGGTDFLRSFRVGAS